jgi:hypothetical protein
MEMHSHTGINMQYNVRTSRGLAKKKRGNAGVTISDMPLECSQTKTGRDY